MVAFGIDWTGNALVHLADGSSFVRSRIVLHSFHRPDLLLQTRLGLFTGVEDAGPFPSQTLLPERKGRIHQGAVELINVTRDLLVLRRQFQFFPQGALRRTGKPTDLAIAGTGFYIVREPKVNSFFATRHGRFHFDGNGYLVTSNGRRVQGYNDDALREVGDIRLEDDRSDSPTRRGTARLVQFDAEGRLSVNQPDGTVATRGQILLRTFAESYALRPAGGGYFTNLLAARPSAILMSPGTRGAGRIVAGAVEMPGRLPRLALPPRKGTRLQLSGECGTRCTIEVLRGFKKWKSLGTVTLGYNGEAELVDRWAKDDKSLSYRVTTETVTVDEGAVPFGYSPHYGESLD